MISNFERQIEWRRGKVAEYDAKGMTYQQIADTLKVSVGTVFNDLSWLRKTARENIRSYTEDRLPHLFNQSIVGLTQILREAWITAEKSKYERNRILSLALAKDCIALRLDMATGSDTIDKTISYVTKKQKALEQITQEQEQDEESEIEEPTTELLVSSSGSGSNLVATGTSDEELEERETIEGARSSMLIPIPSPSSESRDENEDADADASDEASNVDSLSADVNDTGENESVDDSSNDNKDGEP
jgi:hypothetical protein